MNIIEYIKKYDFTFEEKEFNEVDNLVFSCLAYVNFKNIVKNKMTLYDVSIIFDRLYKKSDYRYDMSAVKGANKLLNLLKNSKRFKDVILCNYEYIGNDKEQFSAITFIINKKLSYVAFEGTDKLISGWHEDLAMSYKFKVPSQEDAIKYLNKNFTFENKKIIVGGHSKGGNLALVASMYANKIVRRKIIKIYSNDGQGLRKTEIESMRYKKIYNKYNHIIPYNSFVGILLRHEPFCDSTIIDSTLPMILSHSISSWIIEDDHFVRREISKNSLKLDKIVINWLDKYDYETRKYFVNDIFDVIEKNNIKDISEVKKNYFKLIRLLKNSNYLSDKSKQMLNDLKEVIKEINKVMEKEK